MRLLMTTFFAATLSCQSGFLLAQQQSPSNGSTPGGSTQNSQDVPHQQPGTDNPDVSKQRAPTPKQSPGQNSPAQSDSQGTPDVPHQQPGTDNPDVGKQRQSTPGTTGTSTASSTKSKHKRRKSTASQTQTSTQS